MADWSSPPAGWSTLRPYIHREGSEADLTSPPAPLPQGEGSWSSGSSAYSLDEDAKLVLHPERGAFRVAPAEFRLLAYLHKHPGRLFTADELLRAVWGDEYGISLPDLVRVTVYNLRKRAGVEVVDSVRCYGYGVGVPSGTSPPARRQHDAPLHPKGEGRKTEL